MAARVLVVEDDRSIGAGLLQALTDAGHRTELSRTAAQALERLEDTPFDLVLLDLGLPDADGVAVCRQVRRRWPDARIVILTARRTEIDVVVGLDAGADDYLIKPFGLAELLARVRAQMRRPLAGSIPESIESGNLVVEVSARRVVLTGSEVAVRAKEFDLLVFLMSRAGEAIPRDEIMAEVWDAHWYGSTKTLDMHISSLRQKLAGPGHGRIVTLRGVGYRFEPA